MEERLLKHGAVGVVSLVCATACEDSACLQTDCENTAHPTGRSRASIYVATRLPQVPIDVLDILECAAVRVRVAAANTCVASVCLLTGRVGRRVSFATRRAPRWCICDVR
ncbi:hypothetical protein MTO96_046535 [Rhipicephalus appendiculatus]